MAVYERRRRVRAVNPDAASPWPFIGMSIVACDLFLCGASAVIAPWWVPIVLFLLWVPMFGACITWWTPYPNRLVPAGLVGVAVWFAVLVLGGTLFGWS